MALEFVGLSQAFGGERVLSDVSLRVEPGSIVAFLGHNGAGKTTALRIALGLQRAESGSVRVDGFDAAADEREARARIGALIETPGFHGNWSARRNLAALARLAGMDARGARSESERVLGLVGLAPVAGRRVDTFSQGMRQRLGLAQALLGKPRYLLLDEPQNGLDPEGLAELRALLVRLARDERMGVLVSSHQLAELAGFATDVVILRRGVVVHSGPMAELARRERGRARVGVRDAAAARPVLERLGVRVHSVEDARFEVALGECAPETLARGLRDAQAGLVELAPVAPTLEEVYLRAQRTGERAPAPARADEAPDEPLAPPQPFLAVVRYDVGRLATRGGLVWIGALPVIVALLALARRAHEGAADASAVAEERVFSATRVTAFEGIGVALAAGIPLLALAWCGLASQSLAGELARGTLRNLLLRRVGRVHAVLGKATAIAAAAALTYLALAASAVLASAAWLDFDDVCEVLPNGTRFVLTPKGDLWPELARALSLPLLPLLASALIGFACGAFVRGAAAAVGLALGLAVLLDLARVVLRGGAVEGWLPGAHLASPLSDTSVIAYWIELTRGVSAARYAFEDRALLAPAAWIVLSLVLAHAMLRRRAVP
ncbi:MAG: ATP-binding cassette domain-containing protein [Planctomycetes bacterium]|nr:ATP-binding cassette domain-containing protein [Planctomycetota bacterium]